MKNINDFSKEKDIAKREIKRLTEELQEWEDVLRYINAMQKYQNNPSKTIPFDDMPESWADRCSGDGHKRITDDEGNKLYADTKTIVAKEGVRPCAKCGEFPNSNGDDYCMQNLGSVINACCGHGTNKGYIMFDDGRLIEGYFTIKDLWNK